jgi:NADPH:quinone reductase-like Zn-dependent oxidoreductase
VLEFREVPQPEPGPGEVLVRVHAAALNAYDWHILRGDPKLARLADRSTFGRTGPRHPIVGRDFAGRVEAVGADVGGVKPGDDVFGDAFGTFAEYVCAKETAVATKPERLSYAEAAAMPQAGITALVGLRDSGQVQAGQRVLINGASGGVGTFAVQIGKAMGAEVTGVCSSRNVDLVRSLGADHVVDYTRDDFTRSGQRYDVVFDLVANRSIRDLRRALTPTGTIVLSGGGVFEGGSFFGPMGLLIQANVVRPFIRQRLARLVTIPATAELVALRDLVDAGSVTPSIEASYPLAQAADALRQLETEHARAKLVLTV